MISFMPHNNLRRAMIIMLILQIGSWGTEKEYVLNNSLLSYLIRITVTEWELCKPVFQLIRYILVCTPQGTFIKRRRNEWVNIWKCHLNIKPHTYCSVSLIQLDFTNTWILLFNKWPKWLPILPVINYFTPFCLAQRSLSPGSLPWTPILLCCPCSYYFGALMYLTHSLFAFLPPLSDQECFEDTLCHLLLNSKSQAHRKCQLHAY